MADPVKIIRSLEAISTGYTVFERDQVLTDDQLNSLTRYLDDQQRLTRVELIGVGLVGGLAVSAAGNRVSISRGIGVTTDGDLLALAADTVFDRFKPYDETAPVYGPFYPAGSMLKLYELVRVNESDVRAQALSALPAKLGDMAVLAFMESYEKDPDLCTGADCDNLGKDAINTLRFLLVARNAAAGLLAAPATAADAAAALPELLADRPALDAKVALASDFVARYRKSCDNTRGLLADALPALYPALGARIADLFAKDPAPDWLGQLDKHDQAVAQGKDLAIQYFHAFLKDLVDTWNELREVLFADDTVLCPDVTAFPKHLLLGDLAAPGQLRTGRYPAPWQGGNREAGVHARCLVQKLDTLIATFQAPVDAKLAVRITPSRSETFPLEERAIPFYYRPDAKKPVAPVWNFRRGRRGEGGANQAYYRKEYGGSVNKKAVDPFAGNIGGYDFFRIEGHLGKELTKVQPAVEALVRQANLPIAVANVLLHNKRDRIKLGPKFKLTPLHSLHYVLRNDLASHLRDNVAFSTKVADDLVAAVADKAIPASLNIGSTAHEVVNLARDTGDQVRQVADTLIGTAAKAGPLAARKHSDYAASAGQWSQPLEKTVEATTRIKSSLGHVLRTDVNSPFDSILTSKSHLWVGWLDDILKKREEEHHDRLLFARMIQDHPGLEHCGGAARGGTFVLAYDDSGTVVGDFMLPYWLDDVDDEDREEPPLTLPPIRLPLDVRPIKVVRPLDFVLKDFKETNILPDLHIQENYMKFFKDSLGTLGEFINRGPAVGGLPGFGPDTGDNFLDTLLENINKEREQVEKAKEILTNPGLPAETRAQVEKYLKDTQEKLANSIRITTEHYAKGTSDKVRTGSGAVEVTQIITQGIGAVTNQETSGKLRTDLEQTRDTMGDVGRETVGNIVGMFGH